MRKLCIVCLIGMAMLSMSGCAVFMAGNQPSKKNLNVLNPGSSRNYVIAELGHLYCLSTVMGQELKSIHSSKVIQSG